MSRDRLSSRRALVLNAMVAVAVTSALAACGGSKADSPTNPTPTPPASATRIITIAGDLSFGDLLVGTSAERPISVRNTGNGPMTVTGITGPGSLTASWTSGQIPAGGSQDVMLRFAPTEARSYVGTVTVSANHTSGLNTIPMNARGVNPLFRRTGTGDTVFDMPTSVSRVRITGDYSGGGSNFIVHIGGRGVVNEIIGTRWPSTHFEGTYVTSGGVVEILSSSGVSWSFEEVR